MALASQAPRSTASVRSSSGPSRPVGGGSAGGPSTRAKLLMLAAAGTIVAFVAYGLSKSNGTSNQESGTPGVAKGPGTQPSGDLSKPNPGTVPNAPTATGTGSLANPTNPTAPGTNAGNPPAAPAKLTMGEPPTNTLVPPPSSPPAIAPPVNSVPGTGPGTGPGTTPSHPAGTPTGSPATTPSGSGPGNPPANTPANTPANPSATPNPAAPPVPAGPPVETNGASREARDAVENATRAINAGRTLEARTLLNRALMSRELPAAERNALRAQIAALNDTLFFGPNVATGDPVCDTYTIAAGDYLATIVSKQGLPVEWQLLQRINRVNPSALRIGQKIKVVRQPLHAIVHKSEYRMDVYAGDPLSPGATGQTGPDGQDPSWTFIRSFRVGLGESDGTPEGTFVIKPKSKLVNPRWVNPRDPKMKFEGGDPKNPIGKHWLGLEGVDEATRKFTSYGIHGTIDPDSIGKQLSMGCVRLAPDDIAMVYEMLKDKISTVKIVR